MLNWPFHSQSLLCHESASSHVLFDHIRLRSNIEIKDIHRYGKRGTSIRNIHNAGNMTLHRRTTEQQIYLIITIAIAPEILNNSETSLSIGDCRIQEMLLAILVDRETLEREVSSRAELRLYRACMENW